MNRAELQLLADIRIADAEVLLQAQRWPAAYYLLGYAVESALKACLAGRFEQHQVPDRKFVNDFYTHDLEKLLSLSGHKGTKELRAIADSAFEAKWNAVRDWTEASRYDASVSEAQARDLYAAVTDATCGVLPWVKTFW